MGGMKDTEKKGMTIQERRKSSQLSVMGGRDRDTSNLSKMQSGRTGSKTRKTQVLTSATLLKQS